MKLKKFQNVKKLTFAVLMKLDGEENLLGKYRVKTRDFDCTESDKFSNLT